MSQWLLEQLLLQKKYFWNLFVLLPCQFANTISEVVTQLSSLDFCTSPHLGLFLQTRVRYFPNKTKHCQRHNGPRLLSWKLESDFKFCHQVGGYLQIPIDWTRVYLGPIEIEHTELLNLNRVTERVWMVKTGSGHSEHSETQQQTNSWLCWKQS